MISRQKEVAGGPAPVNRSMRRTSGQPAWGTVAVTALVLLGSGFGLVRAARVRGAASLRKPAAPVVATAPAPAPEAPEMPSLLVGPPVPEKPAAESPAAGGHRVAPGPMGKCPPLPPVPGGVVGAIPAVPLRIVGRAPGADLSAGGPPVLPDPSLPATVVPGLPPRPARSAETSAAKPLTLRLRALPSVNSIQGPGQW